MRWTGNVARGAWMRGRLHGWGSAGGIVPGGFEAIARILHPIAATRVVVDGAGEPRVEERPLRWADIAAAAGAVAHPAMQWRAIGGQDAARLDVGDGWSLAEPEEGRLDLPTLECIAEHLAAESGWARGVTAGFWIGHGALHPSSTRSAGSVDPAIEAAERDGLLLELPGREYVLFEGALQEFRESEWARTTRLGLDDHLTPNLLWPDDDTWTLASEIDLDSTLVAGSRSLVDALLQDARIEAVEIDEHTDLTWDGDRINR